LLTIPASLELDARGNSSAAAARVQSTVNGLQEEIKSLKRQLEKVQSEKETLENEARLSSSGGIFGNGGFGGQAGSNKDRSTIMTLENEVAALRRENLKLMQQSRSVSFNLKCEL
jgi:ATP-dependent Clp protease ATP-binding subunit ClpA